MIALPLIVIWLSSQVLYLRLSTALALVLSVALSTICVIVLALIWERRSKTTETSFSELMIWSWYRLNKAERRLEQGLQATETARSHGEQLQVLHELTAALESKDPYTRGHSKRVERHSFRTGVAMGLGITDVEVLRMSASLHDVGKIRVPNSILHKPGALSEKERAMIEEHSALGAQMVAIMGDEQVVETVRHHHERWDGRGYPDGIAGIEIPLFARVIAVADSYDAIRSTRPYRTGMSRNRAVAVLTEEAGHQFDANVVEAFLKTLPARGRAVAWLTSLTIGPAGLWRYFQQLFQRFGSTALAPALGAAGAAVILGSTSLLSPAVPAAGYALNETPDITPSPRASSAPQVISGTRDPERVPAQEQAGRRDEKQKKGEKAAGATSDSKSSASPAASPQEDPVVAEAAPASDTGGGAEASLGDPNEQGRDCVEGKRKESKGSRSHCD